MNTDAGVCEVWCVPLAPGDQIAAPVWAVLSPQEQVRAGRFHHPEDRVAYGAAHALLRLSLGQAIGQPHVDALQFSIGPFGKPALQQVTGPQFNLSHCRSMVCVAVCTQGAVGVDVEPIDRGEAMDMAAVARDVFTPAEQAQLAACSPAMSATFMRLWTLKEAVVKASGAGLSRDLKSFGIELREDAPILLHRPTLPGPWQIDTRVALVQWVCGGHVLALALAHAGCERPGVQTRLLTLGQLARWATVDLNSSGQHCTASRHSSIQLA